MSPAISLVIGVLASANPAVDFDTQIMPILTQAGCNSGACHGAAVGRGGFALSLYGSNPALDFAAITQQWEGRRINLSRPDRSLFLRKPIADIDHGGDQRFAHDSEAAEIIRKWIQQGAQRHQQRQLVQVTITPDDVLVNDAGGQFSVSVTARFDDGTASDVTSWSVLTPDDPAALEVAGDGLILVRRPGRHLLLVRYLDRVLPVHATLPYSTQSIDFDDSPSKNRIDEVINDQLARLALPPSPAADDATFLRRVTLDLTGRLPTLEQTQAYLADNSTLRKTVLVDTLLASPEFIDYWTYEFGKLLRLRPIGNDRQAALTFAAWLRKQLEEGTPYDDVARTLLTAEGDSHTNGPATFHRVISGAREQAEFVSELFLGVRLRCANCHDHPLDHWTQDDYHGLAAIFARIQRGPIVSVGHQGEISHPRNGEAAVPRIPGTRFLGADGDQRSVLADWMTSPDNPLFARAIVNRLWRQMMSRGLVEPVDDLRATNPGTHPQLLDWLADDFVNHGYDLRHTLRRIASSAAYQRSSQPTDGNRIDDRFFSRYFTEPLEPEVLADAVADVTGTAFDYGGQPTGTRAIDLIDPHTSAPSLDVLGRCDREGGCESSASAGGVTVKLHLLNGDFLNQAIIDDRGRLHQLLVADDNDGSLIDEFYLRGLTRPPNAAERTFWRDEFATAKTLQQRTALAEDFLWGLLSSREFMTNH